MTKQKIIFKLKMKEATAWEKLSEFSQTLEKRHGEKNMKDWSATELEIYTRFLHGWIVSNEILLELEILAFSYTERQTIFHN